MKPKVYIETTVVSYYTAWPSRDVVIAGHQQITRDWWRSRLPLFAGVVSEMVLQEAEKGEADAAAARLEAIAGFPVLIPGAAAGPLADGLVAEGLVPREYINDAIYISIAVTNGVEFLVTWNCKHLANALTRKRMTAGIEAFGYECPVICTPEELLEQAP